MSYAATNYQDRASHPMWHNEARLVTALAGQAGRGLAVDVGGGGGELLEMLSPVHGIGMDLNPTAVDMAERQRP